MHDVYKRCDLARDQQQPDTLQMLGAIETRIEELIQGLDEAYQQAPAGARHETLVRGVRAMGSSVWLPLRAAKDEELVMRLEWQKERDRRERARALRVDARGVS